MKQASARQRVSKFQNQFVKDIYQVIFSGNEPPILTGQGGALTYSLAGTAPHSYHLSDFLKNKKKKEISF
jgi:hypothetical protein